MADARLARGADQVEADLTKCLSHHVDERLQPSEVAQIEAAVRRRTKFPVIFIGDPVTAPAGKRGRLDRVEARVLERCTTSSAGGTTFILKRTSRGWKLDSNRGGFWGSVA
jgi:hypothetical protein